MTGVLALGRVRPPLRARERARAGPDPAEAIVFYWVSGCSIASPHRRCCRSSRSPTSSPRRSSGASSGRSRPSQVPLPVVASAAESSAGPGPLCRRPRRPRAAARAEAEPLGRPRRCPREFRAHEPTAQPDRARRAQAGHQVGPYRIEVSLGVGGMGHVYRAIGPGGRGGGAEAREPELAPQDRLPQRFNREADAAAKVESRHVVPVLDAGEHEGMPYMAQQFIAGGSLAGEDRARGTDSISRRP